MNILLSNGWMLAVGLLCAAIDWFAVARRNKNLEYVFKPATMIAVIIGALGLSQGPHDQWQAIFFIAGFGFSLAGDIFLMLPDEKFFLPGLVSFLFAHVSYIAGLNSSLPPVQIGVLQILIVIAVVGLYLFSRIGSGLRERGQAGRRLPIAIYSVVISLMLFSAWATLLRADWTTLRRGFVIAGGTLFFISDSMLAWNKFVQPFPLAKLGIIITYHLGQLALAASIVQYSSPI